MELGVYYYPEAWPRAQWERDIAGIRRHGFEFVHMGEFAWAYLEPEEGRYDFVWLDETIALAQAHGLKVILCTPTATPPVWLTEKYPEVLMVDDVGRRQDHGTRQHACWSGAKYREFAAKIARALGERYGNDARVWGWQIDNEPGHYGKARCYCEACQQKFQAWLQSRYREIAALNRDWGNQFWSQLYQRFDQIRIPNPKAYPAQFNPHHMLDWQRWFAEEAADYLRMQATILREYGGAAQWITTNHIHNYAAINPALNRRDFDLVTWTHYPVFGTLNEGPLGYRLGSAAALSFACDFMRAINGQHGIMELQPGQVNWGAVNPQPYPGAVRLWIMRCFAGGAKFVCTYRYRQPLYGAELYHYGVVGPDGVTLTSGGADFAQGGRELQRIRVAADPGAAMPPAYAARRAAILYSYEVRWDIDNHNQTMRWDTYGHLLKYHRALKRVGAPVDVITEAQDFSAYPFLIAPAYQLVDASLVARWTAYVENGGHLVLTSRTGHKDRRGHLWEGAWAQPILGLIGGRIEFYDTLPAPISGHVRAGAERHPWCSWSEVLSPDPTTEVWATYDDHYYAGRPAAISRRVGKGSVTYIGVDSSDGGLEDQLVRAVYVRAGVPVAAFASDFLVDWRDGLWVATNFTSSPQAAPIAPGAEVVLGEATVPVAGVTVWKA